MWGGGNRFVRSLVELAPNYGITPILDFSPDAHAIVILDPRNDGLGIGNQELSEIHRRFPTIPILHRVNECDARKGTTDIDLMLRETSAISSRTVFVSDWIRAYHLERGWRCPDTSVVYNGVDLELFKPISISPPPPIRVVTHHWSNNSMKGFDYYDALDEVMGRAPHEITFTYIGRERSSFKHANVIPACDGAELATALAQNHVYVTASRFDPGPNHVLEALACKLPVLSHVDGGGAVEFVGANNVFASPAQLLEKIRALTLGARYRGATEPNSWSTCVERFCREIHTMVSRTGILPDS